LQRFRKDQPDPSVLNLQSFHKLEVTSDQLISSSVSNHGDHDKEAALATGRRAIQFYVSKYTLTKKQFAKSSLSSLAKRKKKKFAENNLFNR